MDIGLVIVLAAVGAFFLLVIAYQLLQRSLGRTTATGALFLGIGCVLLLLTSALLVRELGI